MTDTRVFHRRSLLGLLALAATFALLAGMLVAGARAGVAGSGDISIASGTVKPKPPPR